MTITEVPAQTIIWPSDYRAIVAFWCADEALTDSEVAYPPCPGDRDKCDHSSHQPLQLASGRLFMSLLSAVLGEPLAARVAKDLATTSGVVELSLARCGVVVGDPRR